MIKILKFFTAFIFAFGLVLALSLCNPLKAGVLSEDGDNQGTTGKQNGTYSMVTSKDYSYGGVPCVCVFSSSITITNNGNSASLNYARIDNGLAGGSSYYSFNSNTKRVTFHVDGIDPSRVNRSYNTYHQY